MRPEIQALPQNTGSTEQNEKETPKKGMKEQFN